MLNRKDNLGHTNLHQVYKRNVKGKLVRYINEVAVEQPGFRTVLFSFSLDVGNIPKVQHFCFSFH